MGKIELKFVKGKQFSADDDLYLGKEIYSIEKILRNFDQLWKPVWPRKSLDSKDLVIFLKNCQLVAAI